MHFDDKTNWLVAREEMDRTASYSIALQIIQSQNQKVMRLELLAVLKENIFLKN